MSGVFLSWSRGHGRTSALADALGLQSVFIYSAGRGGALGRYVRQARETRSHLNRVAPETLMMQLPPAPLLLSFRNLDLAHTALIADLHTGFFLNPKWKWATGIALRWLRKRGACAVVTNASLAEICERSGLRTFVIHDPVFDLPALPSQGSILCPVSYANDEPIDAIFEAARLTPHLRWILTGTPPQDVRSVAPTNIEFPGFVSDHEYQYLMRTAAVVCALTTRKHTMQRAGYEAFSYGIPQVTSDFSVLREFYVDSARYAEPNGQSIASAVQHALAHSDEIRARIRAVRSLRIVEQAEGLAKLKRHISAQEAGVL